MWRESLPVPLRLHPEDQESHGNSLLQLPNKGGGGTEVGGTGTRGPRDESSSLCFFGFDLARNVNHLSEKSHTFA